MWIHPLSKVRKEKEEEEITDLPVIYLVPSNFLHSQLIHLCVWYFFCVAKRPLLDTNIYEAAFSDGHLGYSHASNKIFVLTIMDTDNIIIYHTLLQLMQPVQLKQTNK